uniref:Protein AATF n=1 Tax=Caenorhabditis tropicalis TaxID=1561998 RepID=A0A1I7T961_9PELO
MISVFTFPLLFEKPDVLVDDTGVQSNEKKLLFDEDEDDDYEVYEKKKSHVCPSEVRYLENKTKEMKKRRR